MQNHTHNSASSIKLPFNTTKEIFGFLFPIQIFRSQDLLLYLTRREIKEVYPYSSTLISRQIIPAPQVLLQQHRAAWSIFWAGYPQRTTVGFVVFIVNTSGQ